jgi:predicted phage terminase large subunit-like protein
MSLQELQPAEAARELLRRRGIRRNFTEWSRHCGFEPAAHHKLLISKLEAVARGEIDRLMVFMPPGSAKSTYTSVLFPPYLLARDPSLTIIAASHTVELAERFGRRVRNLIGEHSNILGFGLAEDSQAAGRWDTSAGGEYFAAGVRGPITGRRADLALIDDPVKSREEADSDIIRERVKDWWRNDLYTRLKPGGRCIVIQTRWHEDDLGGWLLDEMSKGGDRWEVLSLPAIAENNDPLGRKYGEPLWPDWQDGEALTRIKNAVGPRTWSALYQQKPQPDEGTYFKAEWFKRYSPAEKPKALHLYGTSDYAVTEDGGDFTVHRIWGIDPQGDIWLQDGWRGQTTADTWIERQIDLILAHKPIAWFGEAGVIAKAIEPMLRRRMIERRAHARLEWLPSINDKPTRARGFQARASMGTVHIPAGAEGDAILDEYLRFPAGKYDDDVDNGSLIGRALDMTHPAIASVPNVNPNPVDSFRRRERDDADWRTA